MLFTCPLCGYGSERATGAFAHHHDPLRVTAVLGDPLRGPADGGVGVIRSRRERVFGCKPIARRHHDRAQLVSQRSAWPRTHVNTASHEASTVQVHHHRQRP